jgi:predicted permease
MNPLARISATLRSVTAKIRRPAPTAGDIDEELRLHIQYRADDLHRSGLSREEAERRARIEFGGHEKFRQQSHEALGAHFLETLAADVRFAARVLRKSPGFTFAAAATLALAIGANAVVFGLMDGLILRPLNVPHSEDLYGTEYGVDAGLQSYPNYLDLRDRNHSFQDLAAFKMVFTGMDTGGDPQSASGYAATGNYFSVLRLQPFLGRFFDTSDEHGPNSAPYIVLTHAYWHARFHDDPRVIGRVVQLDKHPFTIIGVAPPGFHGTLMFIAPDYFMPIVNQAQVDAGDLLHDRSSIQAIFETFGHLRPGVSPQKASDDVNAIGAWLAKTYPKECGQKHFVIGRTGLTSFAAPAKEFVGGLMLLAGLILLAACANLGSLFAARAADRSREVALRLALGSSRRRIVRGLLTEAALIALAGGIAGLAASVFLLRRIAVWQPFPGAPLHLPVNPGPAVILVALALALVSALLFGMVPVRQVLRANPYEIVKAGSSARIGRRVTLRDVLLVLQIAVCAVLVTSSLVAVRGLVRSLHAPIGIEPRNTMVVIANLAESGYTIDQVPAMQKRLIAALQSIPGVEHVGAVNNYPPLIYTAAFRANIFKEDSTDLRPASAAANPFRYDVSPDYFAAAGTVFLSGRDLTLHDDKGAPGVAVVNRQFAASMFGSVPDALGRYYKLQDGTRVQIVGVVEDGKYLSLTDDDAPAMFLPNLQSSAPQISLIVRSPRDPQQLMAAIRTQIRGIDAGMLVQPDTWTNFLNVVLFPARVATMALGVLGIMGAVLSITGIFGMAAYSVSKRLRELGIRIALGAQRREVLEAALGRALKLLALGSAAGLVLGVLASRVLAYIVYQATPRDPLVLVGVVLAMALLGLLATWIPAQRALSLDPLVLLREE